MKGEQIVMTKNRRKRLIALLLSVCLLIGSLPAMSISFADPASLQVFENGSAVTEATVRPDYSRVFYVNSDGFEVQNHQWQIFFVEKDLWINIQGQTQSSIEVNYAMIETAVSEKGTAQLRCALLDETGEVVTASNAVTITTAPALLDADGSVAAPKKTAALRSPLKAGLTASEKPKFYTVTIKYTYETPTSPQLNGTSAFQSFVATILNNDDFTGDYSINEENPKLKGFEPYVKYSGSNEYVKSDVVKQDFTGLDENKVIYVAYRPSTVEYHYRVYLQNTDNDFYTEKTDLYGTCTGRALDDTANTTVVNQLIASGKVDGFVAVPSQKLQIAADGSTTISLYFDRLYYLMFFDLDQNGYGTDAVYAKYDQEVAVKDPKRSGYVFNGWSYSAARSNADIADSATSDYLTFRVPIAKTVGASGVLATYYYAVWSVTSTEYTVVYWLENPNDSDYSFLTSKTLTATTGTVVSGQNDLSDKNIQYYIYNDVKTDKNVVVEGDGSTIVNVYYLRKQFSVQFTVSTNTYVTSNGTALKNLLAAHTHTDDCYEYVCGVEEHKHTASCELICGKTQHAHTSACCGLPEHTHVDACYSAPYVSYGTNGKVTLTAVAATTINNVTPQNGIYRTGTTGNRKYFVKYNNTVYQLSTNNQNANFYSGSTSYSVKRDLTCGKTDHTHGDGNCVYTNCPADAHFHTAACYSCGKTEHVHTKGVCERRLKCVTKSTNAAINGVAFPVDMKTLDGNTVYVIRGKYQQKVGDIWPTIDYAAGNSSVRNLITMLYEWDYGNGNGQLSKKMTLSSDICDLSTYMFTYKHDNGAGITKYNVNVKYVFDELKFGNETVPESYYTSKGSTYTVTYNNQKYRNFYDPDIAHDFDQSVSTPSLSHKTMDYATSAGDANIDPATNTKTYLAYNREKFSVELHNYNAPISTTGTYLGSVQYGMPYFMLSYKSGNTSTPLKDFVPACPDSLEKDAYYFDGWYTTQACIPGTEVDWENGFVSGNVIFYAKWSPVHHTVKFYETDACSTEVTSDKLGTFKQPDPVIHRGYIGKAPLFDTKEGLVFAGWFYKDTADGNKIKAFDPLNMPVTKDLSLYPVWSSAVLAEYEIRYRLKGTETDLAEPLVDSMLAGNSKIFYAKGEPQWYPQYVAEHYFPTVPSTTLLISPNSDENKFTFEYEELEYVEYTVKYTFDTGEEAAPSETFTTSSTINDVPAKFIEGYLPDAFEKRLIASSDPKKNVVEFIYSKSENKGYCHVTYMHQNSTGDGYTEVGSVEYIDEIGNTIDIAKLVDNGNAVGFVYNADKSTIKTKIEKDGSKLIIVYDRIPYNYTVYYKDEDGNSIHEKTVDKGLFGATVNPFALDIDGYTVVGAPTKALRISNVETENEVTFYYTAGNVQIRYLRIAEDFENGYYVVIPPDNTLFKGGSISNAVDNIKSFGEDPTGSQVLNDLTGENYAFMGWYVMDEDGDITVHTEDGDKKARKVDPSNDLVTVSDNGNKLTPKANSDGLYVSDTYFALYQELYTTLTIDREDLEEGEEIIYHVQGKSKYTDEEVDLYVTVNKDDPTVVINDLPIGTYTITEEDDWSWRHETDPVTDKFISPLDNEVTFTGEAAPTGWFREVLKKVNDFVGEKE